MPIIQIPSTRPPGPEAYAASQMPNATDTTAPATNSAKMIRRRRVVPWAPYMSIAASRRTFMPAMVSSAGGPRARLRCQPFCPARITCPASLNPVVPKTSSTSREQVIFVNLAADAGVSSDAVLLKIDRFWERFQRRAPVQRAARAGADCGGLPPVKGGDPCLTIMVRFRRECSMNADLQHRCWADGPPGRPFVLIGKSLRTLRRRIWPRSSQRLQRGGLAAV